MKGIRWKLVVAFSCAVVGTVVPVRYGQGGEGLSLNEVCGEVPCCYELGSICEGKINHKEMPHSYTTEEANCL